VPLLCVVALLLPACSGREARRRAAAAVSVASHVRRADACHEVGDYAGAMAELRAALRSRPGDPELLGRFALAARLRFYQTGEDDYRDQELDALRRAVKAQEASATLQVDLGTALWESGRRRDAGQAYRRALELEPGHPDAAILKERIARAKEDEPPPEEEEKE
jgi:Flp pilus assembly protein TadD